MFKSMFKDEEAREGIIELRIKILKLTDDMNKKYSIIKNDSDDFQKTVMSNLEANIETLRQSLVELKNDIELISQREKLNSDFLKKEISEVVSFNRDLFVKDFLFNTTKDIRKEFESFKSGILRPLMEAKWEYEKAKQGQAVIARGAKIIEERNKLYEEILAKERSGKDVEKERIQLATMDKIIEESKK